MKIIIDVLTQALNDNLSYVALMDVVLAFLYIFNILLGTILGTTSDKFDVKKFFFGILKAVCLLLIVFGICYILNVFTITMNQLKGFITISTEAVNTLEVIVILATQGLDIAAECLEKIRAFRELKYVSPSDVVLNDQNIIEPTELRG